MCKRYSNEKRVDISNIDCHSYVFLVRIQSNKHGFAFDQQGGIACVTVNGITLDILWIPPFKTDITEMLTKGKNNLNVEITSTSPCVSPGLLRPVRLNSATRHGLSK